MALALETFVKQLTDSGIIAPGKLENFIPPKAHPQTAEQLVAELVKQNQLTAFQAERVSEGELESLVLGGYTILDKIGAGGMGQVFKAQHRKMERAVAIKMLPPSMTKDAVALARFQREVVAAAKLRHPNIVAADDADEANGVHFLVMEYVDGKDLSVLVKKNGPFPVAKAVNYILQAAKGLEFAHKKGVIHRDIKPANLLLDGEGTVRILDMGLARIEEGDGHVQAELTGTGAVMGTVDYMAPEQGLSTKHADARADIYSLGCTLYYLIAGKPTYDGETVAAKLVAHHTHPVPSLRDAKPDVPKQVEAVFKKMVAKKVEDRYQTMSQVVADLEKCQATLKTVAANDETAAWQSSDTKEALSAAGGKKPPRKNIKLLAGAAGFLLVLLAVIVIVRNKDGKEIARLEVPDGNSVEGQPTPEKTPPVTPAKPITTFSDPKFQQWMKDVATMPAEKQVDAVSEKLVELNPGFDGKVGGYDFKGMPKIESGVVTELWLASDNVTDISPIRALVGLKILWCGGGTSNKRSILSDLSPLRGMKLTKLTCRGTKVSDLSPLQGMPLSVLFCEGTWVSDLSPLQGMPLSILVCHNTSVSDLSPLQGCKSLQSLNVGRSKVTPAAVAALQKTLPNCKIEWDDPAKATTTAPATASKPWESPAFQQWMKDVQAMPAEKQIEAVSKKLVELNPGFDGKVTGVEGRITPKIENGVVTELKVLSDNVADISPVRAFVGLTVLHCTGSSAGKGKLSDLSPLRGMKLANVGFSSTQVTDLSPLQGMPLTGLSCYYTQVSDLTPLKGMKLTNLACFCTQVSDLTPLEQCRSLTSLKLTDTKVTPAGVAALQKALPNCKIDWDGATKPITDLSDPAFQAWMKTVAAMPAEQQVEAVTKKLMELNPGFDGKVTNTDGIGTPKIENGIVVGFRFYTDQVTDISPVQAFVGLKALSCTGSNSGKGKLSNLSPLRGMNLTSLSCGESQVSDLSPLQGMNLTQLYCPGTEVSDLSPLQEMPLKYLHCNHTSVSYLSPLHACTNLIAVRITQTRVTPAGVAALQKALPNCKIEWDDPSKAIAGQPNQPWNTPVFQAWMKEVQAMPAEEQIKAVSKKLVELNPGFDGKLGGHGETGSSPRIEAGVVSELGILCDNVTDVSPLRALSGLRSLRCTGVGGVKSRLSDLTPLEGISLTSFNCGSTQVSDLSPIKRMRLISLYCNGTLVADLTPLEGMPLTRLECNGTPVYDLSPLRDCKSFASLRLQGTKVTPAQIAALQKALPNCKIEWDDPSKAATKKLAYLDPAFQQWVNATQALPAEQQIEAVGKKLIDLNPGFDGKATDWDAKGTPKIDNGVVTEFAVIIDEVTDISPIRALVGLKALTCRGGSFRKGKLSDLSPLKGMMLTKLHFSDSQVFDLSPLVGMPLTYLRCNFTQVPDLSPLKGMQLTTLYCANIPNSDLSPLQKMPLKYLNCEDTKVADLSPLYDCKDLKALLANKTKVTPGGVAALQKALPNCKIEWDDPAKPVAADPDRRAAEWLLSLEDPGKKNQVQIRGSDNKRIALTSGMTIPQTPFKVVTIWIYRAPVREADLLGLKNLSELDSLYLLGIDVSEAVLLELATFPKLGSLNLSGAKITDGSAKNIGQIKGLTTLILGFQDFTDSGLKQLESLERLTSLKLTETKVTASGIAALQKALPNCKIEWNDPDKFVVGQPNKPWNTLAFQQWIKDTQALPAEKQIEAVAKKLVELNPGFDGTITGADGIGKPKIEEGVVTELRFATDNVPDLSPVRALVGLKILNCAGSSPGKGKLSDLSSLHGMPLTTLVCDGTQVSDLSPLQGMPLKVLFFQNTNVTNLSPLRGMPLTTLACNGTGITDLLPLQGMKLAVIYCSFTQVFDLSPLKGMPLTDISFGNSQVSDLSSLQGMPLTKLGCYNNPKVSDLSPLRGMPLTTLLCNATQVSDLSPLQESKSLKSLDVRLTKVTASGIAALQKALPNCKIEWDDPAKPVANKLAYLDPAFQQWIKNTQALPAEKQIEAVSKKLMELNPGFDGTITGADGIGKPKIEEGVVTELRFATDNVPDLSPVRALVGLKVLNCSSISPAKNRLSDLSPLQGMKLTNLNCSMTAVADLSPLRGMPLTNLSCHSALFSDLSPLQESPLTSLWCSATKILDLSPLRQMRLVQLDCGHTQVSDLSPLMGMSTLLGLGLPATKVTQEGVANLQKSLPNCKIRWDDPAKGTINASKPITNVHDPAFRAWMKDVVALPAEKQVEAVVKKLQELNPGFDGKVTNTDGIGTPKIENGIVVGFRFYTDNVTDISPVQAFVRLKALSCTGSNSGKGILSNLSPLRGMNLTSLSCGESQISDISPLQGMDLTQLHCPGTEVSDLSPLHACTSLIALRITHTKVTPASVAALQKALPNCKIEWDDPSKPKTPEPAASGTK